MIFRSCERALRLPRNAELFPTENVIETAECPRLAAPTARDIGLE
jgi:hypothetical protein